jgi:S-formylglutathione hydrolase FrmB
MTCRRIAVAVAVGVGAAVLTWWFLSYQGVLGDKSPLLLWGWLAAAAAALALLVADWTTSGWSRRVTVAAAVPLCLLSTALTVNLWVGYLPTVEAAWNRISGTSDNVIDLATAKRMQRDGIKPVDGTVVSVNIPDNGSGFQPRNELVYLPPAWYSGGPNQSLPAAVMVGGEFGTPSDWVDSAGAAETADAYARSHGGATPILVFVDISGAFSNDTECVNGVRGNAADHITKDVLPYIQSTFDARSDSAGWAIVGWSSGGVCAIGLTVKRPELFNTFVDIDGQSAPNAGTKEQTIARLFGGDADAWAAFDPRTQIVRHGTYVGVAGLFSVSDQTPTAYHSGKDDQDTPEPQVPYGVENHVGIANYLCTLGAIHGIECAVVTQSSAHDFSGAAASFKAALPWLAGRLSTPGSERIPLPGAP